MARILVVADAELQRDLAQQFGGTGAAQVLGSPSARRAVVQALIEGPSVVVCARRSIDRPVEEFGHQLEQVGVEAPLVCVTEARGAPMAPQAGPGPIFCSEAELFETVVHRLPADPGTSGRQRVALMASLERLGGASQGAGGCFGNVLELGPTTLVIESPMLLESGQRLALGFFLPRAADGASEQISLTCVVRRATDEMRLQYEAEIQFIEESARRRLCAGLDGFDAPED